MVLRSTIGWRLRKGKGTRGKLDIGQATGCFCCLSFTGLIRGFLVRSCRHFRHIKRVSCPSESGLWLERAIGETSAPRDLVLSLAYYHWLVRDSSPIVSTPAAAAWRDTRAGFELGIGLRIALNLSRHFQPR